MHQTGLHIIMPVKDSIEIAERAICAIVDSGHKVCVFDDNSLTENAKRLDEIAADIDQVKVVHIADITDHPSPNYRLVLQLAQQDALNENKHLLIVESDVIVQNNTLDLMLAEVKERVGMVAAVTVDEGGGFNFPYQYTRKWWYRRYRNNTIATTKRFSFCCTLLSNELLHKADFQLLDPSKNWYDVTISHWSVELGFKNLLMLGNRVLHLPHSSRPWKRLKYTHPMRYYWRKFTQQLDKI